MTSHPYLTDPRNAAAYQTLCDCPRGSTHAWATKAGWTQSQMRTFLDNLQDFGLAKITRAGNVRIFEPSPQGVRRYEEVCEGMRGCAELYLKAGKKLDKVPRYAERKAGTATASLRRDPTPEEARLIDVANKALANTLPGFPGLKLHNWTVEAAEKILARVPLERAVILMAEAGRQFNPSKTGGGPPSSLGHPFLTRYVLNESARLDRKAAEANAREQLPLPLVMMKVEDGAPAAQTTSDVPINPKLVVESPAPPASSPEAWREAFDEASRSRKRG